MRSTLSSITLHFLHLELETASITLHFLHLELETAGLLLGVLAGYYGGWIDGTVLHITNALLSLPSLLLVAIFVSIIGPSLKSVIVVISLLSWPSISRLVRGQILAVRETEFIVAARVIGASDWQVIFRHLLPNILGSVAVAATFFMAQAILLEAALSFLGLGVRPPAPSWGNIFTLATNVNVLQHMPWVWIPPATSIALVVLALNFLGDGLRDAFDPRAARPS